MITLIRPIPDKDTRTLFLPEYIWDGEKQGWIQGQPGSPLVLFRDYVTVSVMIVDEKVLELIE